MKYIYLILLTASIVLGINFIKNLQEKIERASQEYAKYVIEQTK